MNITQGLLSLINLEVQDIFIGQEGNKHHLTEAFS